ncbi:MAG: hypothetical protein JW803_00010 [Endomicrobiales bacterium]|nr:hypothetical protein [Endomicrobiales bacterium]
MRKCLFLCAVFVLAGLSGCKPSYPRAMVPDAVKKLVKKEYGLDGEAKLVGETLYLKIQLANLITTEQKALTDILKKVQGASLTITRVSLSSDAKIRFLVLVASHPTYKLHLRIIQRLDDIKYYLYQKISRSDYEDRLVLEIDTSEDARYGDMDRMDRELTMPEFVGRLVVSQMNMLSRNNPFLGIILGSIQLRYKDFRDGELDVELTNKLTPELFSFFEDTLIKQAEKINKKYLGYETRKVKVSGKGADFTIKVGTAPTY